MPDIGELVSVADVETVVRLNGPGGLLSELVRTGDVSVALEQVEQAASAPAGGAFFVVGPFGSGKSHLLSAVGELLEGRHWLAVRVPLVDYRAEMALEDVARQRAGGGPGGPDRREHWDGVFTLAREGGRQGVVLLLDEVSEWLRAKRGAALTEDLRFLQFLGEWAKERPVVVLAALQESIEEVANVSEKELTRIRDRYHDLRLSMRHVEDLVRGRLVRLAPGREALVEKVGKEIASSFPGSRVDIGRLSRCYPLHPATLDLLEGLRFLLSQNRGVVDFVCRQVRKDLASPYTSLITPERIWDHFSERLLEQRATARLAGSVVPYWERVCGEIFADQAERELALRTVKLLSLLSASPLERPRTAAELAGMLLTKVSDADPAANVAYLEQIVLTPMVARGAYVVVEDGRYSVEAGADAAVALEARLAAARAEINESDRRMVATLVDLGSTTHLPFELMKTTGASKRRFLWQNTERHLVVSFARVAEWAPSDLDAAVENAKRSGAEGVLAVSEPELSSSSVEELALNARQLAAANPRVAIWVPAAPTDAELTSLVDLHSRRLVREQAASEGREDLTGLLERSRGSEAAMAREILARLYFSGAIVVSGEATGLDLPSLAGLAFENQLPRLAAPLLGNLHPLHSRVAPRGELVGLRHVQTLVNELVVPGHASAAALQRGLGALAEGYLVPLGVARVRKDGAVVAPDAARSPAVAEVLRLVGHGGPVAGQRVLDELAEGPLGLTSPEALLLLNSCARAGLVERWRGKKKDATAFFALTGTDSFGPGELVDQPLRESVAALPSAIAGPGPFEPWTSSTQRDAWESAARWLRAREEEAAQVRAGLLQLEDFPALAVARTSRPEDDLRLVGTVVEACRGSASPAAGLRALVGTLGGGEMTADSGQSAGASTSSVAVTAGDLEAAARRLAALARFFRDELRRTADAAAYVTHPELVLPADDEGLGQLRSAVLMLLPDVLVLAAEDRLEELTGAMRDFRRTYVAAYQDAHDRHYGAVSVEALESLRAAPAYRALSCLSGIGAISVPDGLVKVDRMISAAVPAPCRRRVEMELAWKPRCSCGFVLGDPAPTLDVEAVLEVAKRGVRQHLAELGEPRVEERLAEAADQLDVLGRAELAGDLRQLLELARRPEDADPVAIASVSGAELQRVLSEVLAGTQLIVTRDLAALREDLIGRRYPKRRLLELLAAWVDPDGSLPAGGFVEVLDTSEPALLRAEQPHMGVPDPGVLMPPRHGSPTPRPAGVPAPPSSAGSPTPRPAGVPAPPSSAGSPTVEFLRRRFPSLASELLEERPADAFWLAAWWTGRAGPPRWLPARLLAAPRLAEAAEAARSDLGALGELADLDSRCGPGTALGQHVERALGLPTATVGEVAGVLGRERLLRYPLCLAAEALVRRVLGDWQAVRELVDRLDIAAIPAQHYLVSPEELAALGYLLEAATHLGEAERLLAGASCPRLVEDVYPDHLAPVAGLVSKASLATAGRSVISIEAVEAFRGAARRFLASADAVFSHFAESGFPGCLTVANIGRQVIGPLLETAGRAAVVLVDAMRADAAKLLASELARVLPGRRLVWRWAVVPAPTRTLEAVAAMALGRSVPAGAASPDIGIASSARGSGREPALAPFEHLGYEVSVLKRADRDHNAVALRELWASASPVMVAVATSLDERVHHSSVELATMLDDVARAISQRVFASLAALPPSVPVVLLADHGFRENPNWGRGSEGRYVHGGTSLEECVVPVVVALQD